MGFAVLHLKKASSNDAGTSAHIERTIDPKNADKTRTHLNRELIEFPEGVTNRTQAIQHRLDNAGLQRKIGKNQVRVIQVILSGSPDDMKRIEKEGQLGNLCSDNLEWLKKTYGAENIVSAVLHRDETTPHIHASVVPIVAGERRKASQNAEQRKKQYRKKDKNAARLCADDVMARDKLIGYQDSYAKAMNKYGLQRGIEGSKAKHVSTIQFYRDVVEATEKIQENISSLLEEQEQAKRELSHTKAEIKTEKLKNTAVNVATSAIEGIGAVIGTSKVKKQQQEIEELKTEKESLKENKNYEITQLKEYFMKSGAEYKKTIDHLKLDLKKIYELVPQIGEWVRIKDLCTEIGFNLQMITDLLKMKAVSIKGKLYSSEHKRPFETEHSVAKLEADPKQSGRYRLNIDGTDVKDWFDKKYSEFQARIRQTNNPVRTKRQGIRM